MGGSPAGVAGGRWQLDDRPVGGTSDATVVLGRTLGRPAYLRLIRPARLGRPGAGQATRRPPSQTDSIRSGSVARS
jgi:hypothetical protein